MPKNVRAVKAKDDNKMIELKVCFWTNGLGKHGKLLPKHGKTKGEIRIQRNTLHGIEGKSKKFNSLMEIGTAIQHLLTEQGIVLCLGRDDRKYLTLQKTK